MESVALRERFITHVVMPINIGTRSLIKDSVHERPIVVLFKRNNHFFERVIERNVDKAQLASLFRKLLDEHIVELYYMFYRHGLEIRTLKALGSNNWFTLSVYYKSVAVVFTVFDDHGDEKDDSLKIMPLTVLNNAKNKFKSNFEIYISEAPKDLNYYNINTIKESRHVT